MAASDRQPRTHPHRRLTTTRPTDQHHHHNSLLLHLHITLDTPLPAHHMAMIRGNSTQALRPSTRSSTTMPTHTTREMLPQQRAQATSRIRTPMTRLTRAKVLLDHITKTFPSRTEPRMSRRAITSTMHRASQSDRRVVRFASGSWACLVQTGRGYHGWFTSSLRSRLLCSLGRSSRTVR